MKEIFCLVEGYPNDEIKITCFTNLADAREELEKREKTHDSKIDERTKDSIYWDDGKYCYIQPSTLIK